MAAQGLAEQRTTLPTTPLTRDRTRAGVLFVFGSTMFLLLTTAAEALYPGFSLQTNAISDLAAIDTPTTLIEETAIIGFGFCWALGSYYFFRSSGKKRSMILNMLPGSGALLAGFSPENVNVVIHSVGAVLAFIPGGIVVILGYRLTRSYLRYFAVALGGLSLTSTFIIFVGAQIVGPCGTCGSTPSYVQSVEQLGLGLGGWESLIIYPLLVWLIGFGSYLLNFREPDLV